MLDNRLDDTTPVAEIGELERNQTRPPRADRNDDGGGKRKRLPLEEITRFTMVKRIW